MFAAYNDESSSKQGNMENEDFSRKYSSFDAIPRYDSENEEEKKKRRREEREKLKKKKERQKEEEARRLLSQHSIKVFQSLISFLKIYF